MPLGECNRSELSSQSFEASVFFFSPSHLLFFIPRLLCALFFFFFNLHGYLLHFFSFSGLGSVLCVSEWGRRIIQLSSDSRGWCLIAFAFQVGWVPLVPASHGIISGLGCSFQLASLDCCNATSWAMESSVVVSETEKQSPPGDRYLGNTVWPQIIFWVLL